ncbi:MAG: serine hydrolase [Rhizobiaceae bacterium]|nr:serine hydrolase [Rhizobiaceae bacterium]
MADEKRKFELRRRRRRRLALRLAALAVMTVAGVAAWLAVAPPELIRVGSAYSAKIVCSNTFIAGRDPQQVLGDDVQAPGHPLLRLMRVEVDGSNRIVTAGLLGLFARRVAIARDGLGCTVVPDGVSAGRLAELRAEHTPPSSAPTTDAAWPQGEKIDVAEPAALTAVLDDPAMTGPGMRAVVIVKDGRIVGERYGEGFDAGTPLLGWSMTKTVNAAILGTVVSDGKLALDQKRLVGDWRTDSRAGISVGDLMGMQSGLAFDEEYGSVTDVTRMLFLERDMAAFAAGKPLAAPVGTAFNYSSGTAMLLSRLWQDAVGDPDRALRQPRAALFEPLGMRSAVLEADAAGTFVGSSYLYATARDWARFGLLLLRDGKWGDRQILPAAFVTWMREAAPASGGEYGRGQLWLRGPASSRADDLRAGMPADAYWLIGHDGQTTTIIPSQGLVVVRMGLTPRGLGYFPQKLVMAAARVLSAP